MSCSAAVQERDDEETIDAMETYRIVGVRSVQDFVAVQSELARDNLQQVMRDQPPGGSGVAAHCR